MDQKSLSAINGGQSIDTMRGLGKIKSVAVIILDSGSTDNFISQEVVSTLNLPVSNSIVLPVGVASGDKIMSSGVCQDVLIDIHGKEIKEDFHDIPLRS